MRTRRAAIWWRWESPISGKVSGNNCFAFEEATVLKSPRLERKIRGIKRGEGEGVSGVFGARYRRKEIEEDSWRCLGHRPFSLYFLVMWLSEVTVDNYKVPELPESGKVQSVLGGGFSFVFTVIGEVQNFCSFFPPFSHSFSTTRLEVAMLVVVFCEVQISRLLLLTTMLISCYSLSNPLQFRLALSLDGQWGPPFSLGSEAVVPFLMGNEIAGYLM
ncbi:hypothetical protein NC653_025307 [Populus alba x Populus x berolinensis]|uniref:Uncharacterized protein n=1 Tax=Populus alba x Populus x berolinensis TaxID=444605 RepID=A0AAD6MAX9_9ROSI|nr:hypothetical protein NC653_025307 [Populus alba x Populus x berolinensis]